MKAILLPITGLDQAKTRHAPELSPEQRRELVRAMFQDVAAQLVQVATKALIVLVTPDMGMAEFGLSQGWDIVLESGPGTESCSVDRASVLLEERGITQVLRVPADVPLVQARDLDYLLSLPLTPPEAVLVPSREGTGTNAVLRTPPSVFPSRFGPDSLRLHGEEARSRGVTVQVIENPRLALDLDTVEDLREFLRVGDERLESFRLISNWVERGLCRI